MKFTEEDWQALSKLLDEAMDLPEGARAAWLESLAAPHSRLRPVLRDMLARHATAETDDILDTLPKFDENDVGSASASRLPELHEGVVIGPYRLAHLLGRGGMGAVWLAERTDGLIKRAVALKLPHPGLFNAALAERFTRERDILAALVHPHIAKLYDAGVTPSGQPYLALEYVEGTSIADYCDRERLPVRRRLGLFLQVLEAVQYAHSRLVIHRDIKPGNILVTKEGQAVLLDFGIAKLITDGESKPTELTQLGGGALTPDYASPEQIAGVPITTASDVYSLGIVLYELATGERPYRLARDSRAALEEAILAADLRAPSQAITDKTKAEERAATPKRLGHTLKGDLDTIILKALKKRPTERYPTVNAFAEDIIHYLRGEPVLAQPDSTWYRTRKFLGRNKLAATSAAAVALALAAGLGMALWQASIAKEQARIARIEAQTAEAVQSFMEDIFRANSANQSDPIKARETTARELLDIGAAKIDGALKDAPAAKLRILKTLGEMYDDLALLDTQLALVRRRVDLARAVYGSSHPAVAEALLDLGHATHEKGLRKESAQAFAEAEGILDAHKDFTSRTRARLDIELANRGAAEDITAALTHTDRALKILRTFPPSEDLVEALYFKAMITNSVGGDPAVSNAAASEALQTANSLKGQANSWLPFILAELASAQSDLEELSSATATYGRALKVSRELNGEENLTTLEIVIQAAVFYFKTSRARDSMALLEPVIGTAQKLAREGDTSAYAPTVLVVYGRDLLAYGRPEAALDSLRTAEAMRKDREPLRELNAPLFEVRASGLMELGHYAESESLLTAATDLRRAIGHDKTPLFNANVLLRTRLLMITGRTDEASRAFEAFRVGTFKTGAVGRPLLEKMIVQAELDLAKGDANSAGNLAAQATAQIATSANRPYYRTWETRAALVGGKAKLLGHRAAEAQPLLQRAVELSSEIYDPDRSPELADAQIALASCLVDLGQRARAQTLLAQAKAIHSTHKELGRHFTKPLEELEARLGTPS